MATHPLDRDTINEGQRQDALRAKQLEDQFRKDVQESLSTPALRRVLWRFFGDMRVDASPFSSNAMQQSHGIGMADAAKWWLAVIREHCPERESQIRKEAKNAAMALQLTEEQADDNH